MGLRDSWRVDIYLNNSSNTSTTTMRLLQSSRFVFIENVFLRLDSQTKRERQNWVGSVLKKEKGYEQRRKRETLGLSQIHKE